MTTSQNRHPKVITTGGQFAPRTHAEATLLLTPAKAATLAPGESNSFTELADGEVIEALDVSRSDDGSGYFVSPDKTVNIKDLITDSDPRPHVDALDASPNATTRTFAPDEGWDEAGVECTAQLPDGSLTEDQVGDAAWNGTKVVQLHNESDHGSFGSENLGRLIIGRIDCATRGLGERPEFQDPSLSRRVIPIAY